MAKVALLIGVSEYEPGLNPLPGAVKDVEAMQQVLSHPEMGGFTETDIMVLKNPQRQDMEEAIENLFAHRQKDDLLLLFFSGHGIKDDTGRLYLATHTTRKTPRGELIRSSAVPASFIHESMSRSRSKRQVVILDSCFSGAFAEGLSAKDDGTVNIREQLGGEGRAVLTSSSSTEYSFEQQGSDLSIYTRYLIEGITTGAADLDEDEVVSIDELHDYASRKVREIQPTMRPEIYTSREGFKIRLTKVPQGDPKQKYCKEVARYNNRGEIPFVGRKILDALRNRLGLSEVEATAIEDEMLATSRQEFREKLQRYERDFTEALQQTIAVSADDLNSLRQNLQQILGLRNEDTMPIEARVTAQIAAYKQHLREYEQALSEAMRQEYPLSQATRQRLQQMQQEWRLTNKDIASLESLVNVAIEAYRQKLQQYEQVFTIATQQQYPVGESKRHELLQEQQNLSLKNEDIAPIEAKITAEFKASLQKLQQYEQIFIKATQHQYPLSTVQHNQLQQKQQILGLKDENIAPIENRITVEIEAYLQKLQQYEQAFTRATQQQYPLSKVQRYQLRQEQQLLGLKNENIAPIENQITVEIEAYLQKLQQYEQALIQTIQHEYPFSEDIREELKRYQHVLELRDEEVARIEEKVIRQRDVNPSLTQPIGKNSQAIPVNSPNKLRLLVGGSIFAVFAVVIIISSIPKTPQFSQNTESQPSASPSISSTNSQMTAEDLFNRGNDKREKKDYQGAVEDYSQAIKINPNYDSPYYNRGLARYALGDKKGAIEDYSQFIKINPNYPNAYYNRGLARYALGDKKGAIEDFQKAADLYKKQGKMADYTDAINRVKTLQ